MVIRTFLRVSTILCDFCFKRCFVAFCEKLLRKKNYYATDFQWRTCAKLLKLKFAFNFTETSTNKTSSLKEPEVHSDIVANTIKKFDALATPKSKSKSSVKDATTPKDVTKFSSPKLKISTPPVQRKPRPIETASPLTTKRTYSSSPHRLLATLPSAASPKLTPRKVSPCRIKPSLSPVSPKKVVSTIKDIRLTPKPKDVKLDTSIKPKLTTNTSENSSPKGISSTPSKPKKIVIEKHLDTSTSFQKAAAFWKKT